MNFRIVRRSKGYAVEVQKKKWYGAVYWESYINWYGTDKPFHYGKFESALDALEKEVRWNAISNSKK